MVPEYSTRISSIEALDRSILGLAALLIAFVDSLADLPKAD